MGDTLEMPSIVMNALFYEISPISTDLQEVSNGQQIQPTSILAELKNA
jgi:hypothetical protein